MAGAQHEDHSRAHAASAHDPLVDHFFPRRTASERALDLLRVGLEVAAGAAALAVLLTVLLHAYRLADSQLCSWRMAWMMERELGAAELRHDLGFIREALETHHPALYAHTTRTELDAAFARASHAVRGGATRIGFLRAASPAVAAIRCGHTSLNPPLGHLKLYVRGGTAIPLGVQFVEGRAYLRQHYAPAVPVPLGSEILAINDLEARTMHSILTTAIPSDGPGHAFAEHKASELFPLFFDRYIGAWQTYRIRYRRQAGGPVEEHSVPAVAAPRLARSFWQQNPHLDPRHPPFPFTGRVLAGERVAYLRVITFDLAAGRGFRQVLDHFFQRLEEQQVETLILDLRGNTGGPSVLAVDLLQRLVGAPFQFLESPENPAFADLPVFRWYSGWQQPHEHHRFGGRIYALIDGGSFSTTGHFCAVLGAHRDVVFVGSRSGGSFSCNDNGIALELPNSRLRLRVARTVFRVTVAGLPEGRGIVPDIEVRRTPSDIASGRDPVLARVADELGVDLGALES